MPISHFRRPPSSLERGSPKLSDRSSFQRLRQPRPRGPADVLRQRGWREEPRFGDFAVGLARGGLGPLNWVQERPMHDGEAAFQAIDQGGLSAAKIILRNEAA